MEKCWSIRAARAPRCEAATGHAMSRMTLSSSLRTTARPRRPRESIRWNHQGLERVSAQTGLSVEQVVELHTGREYAAVTVGFLPGFAYLRTLDPAIVVPRLPSPRPRVPARSVAIAGECTAVYPFASPGGWRLIGSTDAILFDARRDPPALLREGDRVRFVRR